MSTNIDSDTFRNDKSMWIWLHNNVEVTQLPEVEHTFDAQNGFPKIWLSNGSIQQLNKGEKHTFHSSLGGGTHVRWDGYPTDNVLDYPVNNFKVYVNGKGALCLNYLS